MKFTAAIMLLGAAQAMTDSQIGMVAQMAFNKIDSDGDGIMTKTEALAQPGANQASVDMYWGQIDGNADGTIDLAEYTAFLKKYLTTPSGTETTPSGTAAWHHHSQMWENDIAEIESTQNWHHHSESTQNWHHHM